MVVEALMLTCVWGLFVWGTTVWQMTLAYLLYGVASASETAYYSYLYAVVDKEHYKKITSYTRTSIMLGQFFAYSGGQIIYSAGWVSYKFLNDFSFGAEIFALGVALICPSVKRRLPAIETDTEPASNSNESVKTNSSDSVVVVADEAKFPEKQSEPAEEIIVNELEAIAPAM
uniref:Thiamine transporter 2 n=1 Tax=Panagrolaimus sp. ES5 TaxID=591445 RepID=A0AC34FF46_9BILA